MTGQAFGMVDYKEFKLLPSQLLTCANHQRKV